MSERCPRILLIGQPNVGKSQLFNLLTGGYAVVSNYPGTTVEVTAGRGRLNRRVVEIVDTPGLYSLAALTPEEQITRFLLFQERPDLVIQVADARNLYRMLPLTLELLEADLPLILVLNMMDEVWAAGMEIDSGLLAERLGVPVLPAVLVAGRGLQDVCNTAANTIWKGEKPGGVPVYVHYPPVLEDLLNVIGSRLRGNYGVSKRTAAQSLFSPDQVLSRIMLENREPLAELREHIRRVTLGGDALLLAAAARRSKTSEILEGVIRHSSTGANSTPAERVDVLLFNPLFGFPVLAAVLYFGFYRFVGGVGAGLLVDLMERRLFQGLITPLLETWGETLPWGWLRELLVAEYGVLTLGLRYTLTIILPIMTTFFFFFSFIEDSGYLPRIAYMVNTFMEKLGLNGKAVIPLILGFGCGTLAVLVTRTLENRAERLQTALLLSLAVPCSAQLGLILALLRTPAALVLWSLAVSLSFIGAAGAGKIFFGAGKDAFCLEIPPLRLPRPGVIFNKTVARLRWYLKEVWLLFAAVSVLIWLFQRAGLLGALIARLRPVLASLGLPGETAMVFVYGFFRRDYGAAGLYDLFHAGILGPDQLLVAAVVLTLFLPCLAQMVMLLKEYGCRFTVMVAAAAGLVSWAAGFMVRVLTEIPWISRWL